VLKNSFNHVRLADKNDNAHFSPAFGTNKQTGTARTGKQSWIALQIWKEIVAVSRRKNIA
jgi:hypothetical protein